MGVRASHWGHWVMRDSRCIAYEGEGGLGRWRPSGGQLHGVQAGVLLTSWRREPWGASPHPAGAAQSHSNRLALPHPGLLLAVLVTAEATPSCPAHSLLCPTQKVTQPPGKDVWPLVPPLHSCLLSLLSKR